MMMRLTLQGENANQLATTLGLNEKDAVTTTFPWGKATTFLLQNSPKLANVVLHLEPGDLLVRRAVAHLPVVANHVNAGKNLASILLNQVLDANFKLFQNNQLNDLEGDFEIEISAIAFEDQGENAHRWLRGYGLDVEVKGKENLYQLIYRGQQKLGDLLLATAVLIPALDRDSALWWEPEHATQFANFASTHLQKHSHRAEILAAIQKSFGPTLSPNAVCLSPFYAPFQKDSKAKSVNEQEVWEQIETEKLALLKELLGSEKPKSLLSIGIPEMGLTIAFLELETLEKLGITSVELNDLHEFVKALNQQVLPQKSPSFYHVFPSSPIFVQQNYGDYKVILLTNLEQSIRKFQIPALESVLLRHAKPDLLIVCGLNRGFKPKTNPTMAKSSNAFWNAADAENWAKTAAKTQGYFLSFLNYGLADEKGTKSNWMATFHKGIHR